MCDWRIFEFLGKYLEAFVKFLEGFFFRENLEFFHKIIQYVSWVSNGWGNLSITTCISRIGVSFGVMLRPDRQMNQVIQSKLICTISYSTKIYVCIVQCAQNVLHSTFLMSVRLVATLTRRTKSWFVLLLCTSTYCSCHHYYCLLLTLVFVPAVSW